MAPDMLVALAAYCIVSSVTPGPNNMMLLSSGATFGFRRTVPHLLGISIGCVVMVVLLGIGLAGVLGRLPWLYPLLRGVSTAYLLYLAWRIGTSAGVGAASARARPLSFLGAAAFQWVNPKAWAMTLGATASFARPAHLAADVAIVALMLAVCGLPCIMFWAGGGMLARRLLTRPAMLRGFNIAMAAALVGSLLPGVLAVVRT